MLLKRGRSSGTKHGQMGDARNLPASLTCPTLRFGGKDDSAHLWNCSATLCMPYIWADGQSGLVSYTLCATNMINLRAMLGGVQRQSFNTM